RRNVDDEFDLLVSRETEEEKAARIKGELQHIPAGNAGVRPSTFAREEAERKGELKYIPAGSAGVRPSLKRTTSFRETQLVLISVE
ncbi:hypothetical protein H0H93_016982, partial [Arthromyces matolae]